MAKLFVLLLLFSSNHSKVQDGNPVFFGDEVLSDPITHYEWYDSHLEVIHLPIYEKETNRNHILLENGYAQYLFRNREDLTQRSVDSTPEYIDIIFTNYPYRKEDWVTNYYELLANRIKELIGVDSTLNSNEIRWRLVMQTN